IADTAYRFGARADALADGTFVVTLSGETGAPGDQAARAAACALALCDAAPGLPLALATGRAQAVGRLPVGEAIDRAAQLLREGAGGGAIRIDDVTASLLDERFQLAAERGGKRLLGRREADGARTLLGKPTPCVGRDAELAALEALVATSAEESVARAAVVT